MILTLGVRTSNVTDGVTAWEIRAAATPGRVRVLEIGFTIAAATATTIGLGRAAAQGLTPTTPVDFVPEDPADVIASGVVQSSLAWATPPTIPVPFLRRIALPATVGTGVIWQFEDLTLAVSSSLVLWNLATNSVLDAYAVVSI